MNPNRTFWEINMTSCMRKLTALLVAGLVANGAVMAQDMEYPKTKTQTQIDEYFGVKVADPYRWLEDDVRESQDVKDWVDAENRVTFGYLETLPFRKEIEARLTTLWDYEKYGTPFRAGDRYYYFKNNGLQNQSVLYQLDTLDGDPRALIDPNQWSEQGTVALGGMSFTNDGRYIAYSTSEGGSDWSTWHVMDAETGKLLDDEISWTKFTQPSWNADGSGFYYSRYAEPKEGEAFQSLNLNQKVYFHKLGTSQSDDELVHEDPENPSWGFNADVTEDGRFLIVTVWKGTDDKYRVMYRDLDSDDDTLNTLIDNFDNEYTFIGNEGSVLYFKSDLAAPNRRIIARDVAQADGEWKQIVPEAEETLDGAGMVGNFIVAEYLKDAITQVKLFDLSGKLVREVAFPGIGTASGFGGRRDHAETFYSFSSYNRPPSTFRYDLATGESTLLREAKVDFNPDDYEVKQVFYESKDGTRVPMFISHKKGLVLDGTNPTLLYGYGGFNIPLTPGFSVSRLQWMEMGGVYAVANLRGGGEYGERWHKAGTKTQKQNVFDDFIAAAEWLIENDYTSADHLGIQGGSNGGLLVGACMTQRPDLYGACLPAVGVMDMLRFQEFTAGRFWVDDYGSSKNSAEEFQALFAYSPYHNIQDGTQYPPTLVTTADHDDRVVPGHSFKFTARMQSAQAGENPILIRIETDAGHGAGKPTTKQIEEVADQWAFLVKHLEMKPDLPSDK
ncbi:MAG: prolyl oligopeptidase family serine peptidase [Pirellulaceae bacterium]